MITASVCTIGDEILIGQIVDTNSAHIARSLGELGIRVNRMVSIGDQRDEILHNLRNELTHNTIVITTGGLGPTKDDITKAVLSELSHSLRYVLNEEQLAIIHTLLSTSAGLDRLESNKAQALVPEKAEIIPNTLGTAPVMVFRFPEGGEFGHKATLYALPGVPFEAVGMLPRVLDDIRQHHATAEILHRNLMVYGLAESALAELIAPWEDALGDDLHLAYLPHPLTGIRLRLSMYGVEKEEGSRRMDQSIKELKQLLGDRIYAGQDDNLESCIGRMLKAAGKTLSVAESCTGGEISHLITSVSGSSAYYLGSVTSYAVAVKEKVLGVPADTIRRWGVVSSEVAQAMAEGVRKLTGSDYSISTTGLADKDGDGVNPGGTVWIGVSGAQGTWTEKFQFKNDRKRNIERFSAAALNLLRLYLLKTKML